MKKKKVLDIDHQQKQFNQTTTMAAEGVEKLTEVPVEFFKDGSAFIKKCQEPDQKEYFKIIRAVGIGFIMMGVVGYAVKLVHIPIRYLIV